VPRLLELFRRLDLRASFFVTMGPDRSGVALRRAWRPSFLVKMWRTNALKLYGLRTILSGTLLPASPVGAGAPALLRQIAAEGHEVAPHGFDHVGWQDRVGRLHAAALRSDLSRAARAFEEALGVAPKASAAPGWRTTPRALLVQEDLGFRYASDTRGRTLFRPRLDGGTLKTLQVPTTMPTMDELLGRARDLPGALLAGLSAGLNVFTLHAEEEGGPLLAPFTGFLEALHARRIAVARVRDVVDEALAGGRVSESWVARGRVAGRSGWVTVQREERAA
jgi:undecaprenyl phosphate-alpha-L-ara4FN deformylase